MVTVCARGRLLREFNIRWRLWKWKFDRKRLKSGGLYEKGRGQIVETLSRQGVGLWMEGVRVPGYLSKLSEDSQMKSSVVNTSNYHQGLPGD